MTAAHYEAVRKLLADLPVTLYEGQVPDEPGFPYALLNMDTGRGGGPRLSGRTARRTYDFMVTSVGLTPQAVRVVADQCLVRLLDVRPLVPGFRSGLIRHVSSIPVRPDTDVRDAATRMHPMFSVDSFSFRSTTVS